jgi:hypothetical protein
MNLSESDRYQLKKMAEKNNVVDQTDKIRESKHSPEIRKSIEALIRLKKEHKELLETDKVAFENLIMPECSFLFYNYMELYNIMVKDEMDPTILFNLLDVLQSIENGTYDQQEGSVKVGQLLKEIYIDHKLAQTAKLDEQYPKPVLQENKKISWTDFKKLKKV